ncbi:MAG: TonB-dependent receptor [Bacteroidales bacterium]
MVSGRRSYFDLYSGALKTLNLIDLNFPGYHFYDLNVRLCHAFSEKDKIFLSFYSGKDKILYENKNALAISTFETFSESTDETSGWGNTIGSLRWNHTFRNLFVNSTIAISNYNYYILSNYNSIRRDTVYKDSFDENYSADYRSKISDLIIKTDFDYLISNNHKLTFGVGNTIHTYNPGSNIYSMKSLLLDIKIDTAYSNTILHNNEPYIYFEDEMKLNQKLLLTAGLRFSGSFQGKNIRINAEPRLSANYQISSQFVIKVGYSRMVQYLHLLSTSGLSMPTDIWVPALKGLQPLKSDQINSGISYHYENLPLISIEFYKKWLINTTDLRNGASLLSDLSPWYEKTTQGHGNAEGIEVVILKQEGRITGSINYTYAKADRNYSDLNNGKTFPFRYDRRHDLNISLNYQISKKWDISVLWWYGTGYPVTIPVEKYQPLLNLVTTVQHNLMYYYPSINNYRLPPYHRLDIALHYKITKKNTEQEISLDIFNVYNHKNPVYMYYLLNYSFEYVYLFPIIPSITYTIRFI